MWRPSSSPKYITNLITIELLRKIAESKKPKTQSSTMMCAQSTVQASLKQPSLSSQEEEIKVAPPISTLEVVKEPTVSFSTSITLEE
jgi:type II secretory pathway component PulM